MSVLVAVPGEIWTDSLDSGDVRWYGPKAWRMHGYLIGVAGKSSRGVQRLESDKSLWPRKPTTRSLRAAVYDWPSSGDSETTWLVVTPERVWSIEDGYVYPRSFPFAAGCGAPWALGRLHAAPDEPAEAVRLACAHDAYCGGRVRVVRCR